MAELILAQVGLFANDGATREICPRSAQDTEQSWAWRGGQVEHAPIPGLSRCAGDFESQKMPQKRKTRIPTSINRNGCWIHITGWFAMWRTMDFFVSSARSTTWGMHRISPRHSSKVLLKGSRKIPWRRIWLQLCIPQQYRKTFYNACLFFIKTT